MSLPTQRRLILIVLAALCVFAAGRAVAAQDEVIRVQTELVNLNVVVKSTDYADFTDKTYREAAWVRM